MAGPGESHGLPALARSQQQRLLRGSLPHDHDSVILHPPWARKRHRPGTQTQSLGHLINAGVRPSASTHRVSAQAEKFGSALASGKDLTLWVRPAGDLGVGSQQLIELVQRFLHAGQIIADWAHTVAP